ncbi:MAG: prephenate dehydrogenase/arogenate dehydrogenase family protein [Verrucomicrobiae bacterium]|nr:prephenate dehydrogenase/arogenate dehydrogenase family protein [Verrucomicrobiae bacterium]
MLFSKVAILGGGLLGGSLALAVQERKVAGSVAVWARRAETVAEMESRQMAELVTTDLARAVEEAEMVVLCTPIGAMAGVVERALPYLSPFAVVTDVGSVKTPVVRDVIAVLGGKNEFVGSHPMAGGENAGVAHAKADLFEGAVCILTPVGETAPAALEQVRKFWIALGMVLRELSPGEHDAVVARVSHLPHLLASALVNFATSPDATSLAFCGNGFRDSTRVAAGHSGLWGEILMTNRDEVLQALKGLQGELSRVGQLLENGDTPALLSFLARAARARQTLSPRSKTEE